MNPLVLLANVQGCLLGLRDGAALIEGEEDGATLSVGAMLRDGATLIEGDGVGTKSSIMSSSDVSPILNDLRILSLASRSVTNESESRSLQQSILL